MDERACMYPAGVGNSIGNKVAICLQSPTWIPCCCYFFALPLQPTHSLGPLPLKMSNLLTGVPYRVGLKVSVLKPTFSLVKDLELQ